MKKIFIIINIIIFFIIRITFVNLFFNFKLHTKNNIIFIHNKTNSNLDFDILFNWTEKKKFSKKSLEKDKIEKISIKENLIWEWEIKLILNLNSRKIEHIISWYYKIAFNQDFNIYIYEENWETKIKS